MHDAEVINRVGRISRRQQQRFRPNFKGRAGRAVLDREAHEAYPRRDPESHKLGAGQISGRPNCTRRSGESPHAGLYRQLGSGPCRTSGPQLARLGQIQLFRHLSNFAE